jgi:proliferating cell nuclear antigen
MAIDAEHLGIPDTEYKAVVSLPSGEFQRLMRDLAVIGDTCLIGCGKEGVKFAVSGDLGSGSVLLKKSVAADKPDDQVMIAMDEPVDLTFALRYLNFFTKATPLAGQVQLSMSPDVPLVVQYSASSGSYLRFYLAPKIDEEAENAAE